MYNALPQKYNYNRQKTIGISTGINVIIALILVKTHGKILFNHTNISAPKQSIISIQQYKIISHNTTKKPTENTQVAEPPKEVPEEIKPKEKPSKNVVKELQKENTPPQESQQKAQKQQAQQTHQAQNSKTPTETQEDTTPTTEATHFGMNNIAPKYPIISFQLGEHGNVVIEYIISKDGTVKEASVAESSGFLRLDRIALIEFKKWKFKPATNLTGTPVDSRKKIITFAFDIKTQAIKAE